MLKKTHKKHDTRKEVFIAALSRSNHAFPVLLRLQRQKTTSAESWFQMDALTQWEPGSYRSCQEEANERRYMFSVKEQKVKQKHNIWTVGCEGDSTEARSQVQDFPSFGWMWNHQLWQEVGSQVWRVPPSLPVRCCIISTVTYISDVGSGHHWKTKRSEPFFFPN